MKSGFERRFYDLGRINYFGQKEVDFKFDPERILSREELETLEKERPSVASSYQRNGAAAKVCGGGPEAGIDETTPAPTTYYVGEDRQFDAEELLGETPIDEFFDPRGFARQRARAKRAEAEARASRSTVA
jgi:hypothetical protein